MEERRRITTVRQLELLLEFLEERRDLALGQVRSKEARSVASRLWRECAEVLNAEGPARTAKEWSKVWNDQQCRVRGKLVTINANQRATGGGPSNAPSLTALDKRIANILGRDVGPMPNVSQDQLGEVIVEHVVVEELQDNVHEMQNISPPMALNNNEPGNAALVPPSSSVTGQFPTTLPGPVRHTGRERRRTQLMNQPLSQAIMSTRTALEELRSIVLTIERLKAEATMRNAEAFRMMAEAIKLIAESLDRLSRKFCQEEFEEI